RDRRLRSRQPRQGRGGPGGPEREPRARARADARPAAHRSPRMSVTAARGFVASGVHCGIRRNDRLDLSLVHSVVPATGAGMFTALTTDYPLEPGEAIEFLRPAVEASFNAISVDGECSTNDAVILLANGASGVERTPASDEQLALAVRTVCGELARQIVVDGEGATVLAEIAVRGAVSDGEARAIAERIATSPLVKTAL